MFEYISRLNTDFLNSEGYTNCYKVFPFCSFKIIEILVYMLNSLVYACFCLLTGVVFPNARGKSRVRHRTFCL